MLLTLTIVFWLIAAFWLFSAVVNTILVRRLAPLDSLDSRDAETEAPTVSVVIPARDEADAIAAVARSFLMQEGVSLQLIVVDDRSADATTDALQAIAMEDPRLEPVRIDALPIGWLGKSHALLVGSQRAMGAWILFADADTTLLTPDVLRRTIELARVEGAEHVCLFPFIPAQSVWSKAMACAFFIGAARRLDQVNHDRPGSYFGVGAFNLVKTDLYRSFGGHEPLKLEVIDDVHIGALVRRAGGRSRFRTAFDDVQTTWGSSVSQLVRVLEKNLFAAVRYSAAMMLGYTSLFLVLWGGAVLGPVVAVVMGVWTPIAAAAALLLSAVPAAMVARRFGWSARVALLTPIVMPVLIYAAIRSMLLTLRRGGVAWRDTVYPLAELKAGRFR